MSKNALQKNMMRKLQLTGGSTYVLSLPKEWVTQNKLKKGSYLLIRDEGKALSILPADEFGSEQKKEATITVITEEDLDSIIRKIVSTYLVGYDIIHIKTKNNQQMTSRQRSYIKSFVRNLLVGTEILSDTSNELILQVLLNYPELSVQSALRRMAIITSSMHKDAIVALKKLDSQLAKSIIITDNEVDRFHLYIIRQLKTAIQNLRIIRGIGLESARECLGYRLITKSIERTADHAVNIAENILSLKKRLSKEIIEKIEELNTLAVSMFDASIESLFKRDYNLAESIILKLKNVLLLENEAINYSRKAGMDEIVNLRLIIESMRRTAEYATDIAEIVLNLTIDLVLR